jgi:hypothetical protein
MTEAPKEDKGSVDAPASTQPCFLRIHTLNSARDPFSERKFEQFLSKLIGVKYVEVECKNQTEIALAVATHKPKYVILNMFPKEDTEISEEEIGGALFECSVPFGVSVVFLYTYLPKSISEKVEKWASTCMPCTIFWWEFTKERMVCTAEMVDHLFSIYERFMCLMDAFCVTLFKRLKEGYSLLVALSEANEMYLRVATKTFFEGVNPGFPDITGKAESTCPRCSSGCRGGFLNHECRSRRNALLK